MNSLLSLSLPSGARANPPPPTASLPVSSAARHCCKSRPVAMRTVTTERSLYLSLTGPLASAIPCHVPFVIITTIHGCQSPLRPAQRHRTTLARSSPSRSTRAAHSPSQNDAVLSRLPRPILTSAAPCCHNGTSWAGAAPRGSGGDTCGAAATPSAGTGTGHAPTPPSGANAL